MGIEAGFNEALNQIGKLTAEVEELRAREEDVKRAQEAVRTAINIGTAETLDRLAAHQRFEIRLRSYLARGTDCYPSDLEAMMEDELPKETP